MSAELFQLMPALDAATEAALRSSIERFGVLVPVVRDQHGRTIDGHHRSRIADQMGVAYPTDTVQVGGDAEAREIARTLNADRRHLTVAQRRGVVADLREQGHSLRAIAGAVGASKTQVERDLSTVPEGTVPERVLGLDGRIRPATRPAPVPVAAPVVSDAELEAAGMTREQVERSEEKLAGIWEQVKSENKLRDFWPLVQKFVDLSPLNSEPVGEFIDAMDKTQRSRLNREIDALSQHLEAFRERANRCGLRVVEPGSGA